MASGGHLLLSQKQSVEARIKILVNQDLREICKHYNKPVSGTKVVLQARCQESEQHTHDFARLPASLLGQAHLG